MERLVQNLVSLSNRYAHGSGWTMGCRARVGRGEVRAGIGEISRGQILQGTVNRLENLTCILRAMGRHQRILGRECI